MRVLCAGRIAEEHFCNDVNTGAAADIRQATELARRMITEWGMNDKLGFIAYDGEGPIAAGSSNCRRARNTPTHGASHRQEVRRQIDTAYADAQRIVQENVAKVKQIAEALVKYETITGRTSKH